MLIEKLHSFLNSYNANGTKLTCFFKSQLYIVCQMDLDIFCAFSTFCILCISQVCQIAAGASWMEPWLQF